MSVGLIGYGRFGKLAARFLTRHTTVFVYDRTEVPRPSRNLKPSPLAIAAAQPIVILAVPISNLQSTLRTITPHLKPSSLVVDVCSVKAQPVSWMRSILPQSVFILATHPLFGPDSAKNSLRGHHLFVCPVRVEPRLLRHAIRHLKSAGLVVHQVSAREHDKLMAETLFLAQFVGRVVSAARMPRHAVSTNSYAELMKLARIADNDSRELFRDMFAYNPFAKKIVRRLVGAQRRIFENLLSFKRK